MLSRPLRFELKGRQWPKHAVPLQRRVQALEMAPPPSLLEPLRSTCRQHPAAPAQACWRAELRPAGASESLTALSPETVAPGKGRPNFGSRLVPFLVQKPDERFQRDRTADEIALHHVAAHDA